MLLEGGLEIPAHLPTERHAIGGVLLRPELLAPVLVAVAADDFYRPWHGHVLDAAVVVGIPPDPLQMTTLVHRELIAVGVHQDGQDAVRLLELLVGCPDTRMTVAAAERVHELARCRRAMTLVAEAYNRLGIGCPVEVVAPLLLQAAEA